MAVNGEYVAEIQREMNRLQADAKRYQWLRDNGHLNIWWSVEGPQDRCENIDSDIDAAREGRGHE